jgi:hypothetical protein
MKTTTKLNPLNADRDPRLIRNLGLIGLLVLVIVVAGVLVVYALQPPEPGLPASGTVLTWHREGGLAGFCDRVTIHETGDVYASSCQGEAIGRVQLDAEQLATLYGWVDSIKSFEYEDADPATEDAMTVRLQFYGTGKRPVQEADRQLMLDLAQRLYNEAWKQSGGASAVCPTPGAGQQLLLDREAGYCLLYPAEYSMVLVEPGVRELVVGSVLNHERPRLSIAIEEAAGRTLEEVAAQLEADYVPTGWEVARAYTTVDGVEAVVLDNLPGQDLNRRVAFLRDDRLYTLFLAPIGDEGSELREQAEMLYRPVLDSFRFLTPEVLIQLDWEGGFTLPEAAVPFGRVPAFTLLADGRVFYLDWDDTAETFQEQLLVAQLGQDEAEALLQRVLDLGFAGLESHLDFCMVLDDGTSTCVADAGYSVLRVRLPEGNLREIRNWAGFANDPEALVAILDLLTEYRHPEAVLYVPDRASLFIRSIPSAEGVKIDDWPLDPGWLTPPAPGVEQWAGVLRDQERDVFLQGSSWNMGTHYYRYADRFYQVVLVPWLPGTDYTDAVMAYRSP